MTVVKNMPTFIDAHDMHVAKAVRDAQGVISYSSGGLLGDLISTSVTPDTRTFTHTSEHAGTRSSTRTYGGNISVVHEPIPFDRRSMLYGHEEGEDGELIDNIADHTDGVGVAYYKEAMDDSFEGVFLPFVKFAEGTDEANVALPDPSPTQFTTTGVCEPDDKGNWRYRKRFESKEEAIAWIKIKLGITA